MRRFQQKKFFQKYYPGLVGGFFIFSSIVAGCNTNPSLDLNSPPKINAPTSKNMILILKETEPDNYKIENEIPSSLTRLVIIKHDGSIETLNDEQTIKMYREHTTEMNGADSASYNSYHSEKSGYRYPAHFWHTVYHSNYGYKLDTNRKPADDSFRKFYSNDCIMAKSLASSTKTSNHFSGHSRNSMPSGAKTGYMRKISFHGGS